MKQRRRKCETAATGTLYRFARSVGRAPDCRSRRTQMLALALAVLVGAAAAFSPGPIQYGSVYMNASGPTVSHTCANPSSSLTRTPPG